MYVIKIKSEHLGDFVVPFYSSSNANPVAQALPTKHRTRNVYQVNSLSFPHCQHPMGMSVLTGFIVNYIHYQCL